MKYKRMKMEKMKAQKMKNTDILSAGSKAYAKKRREKQETVESIDFDFDKRQEFLTGFRKRKLERKQAAREKYAERERQERIKLRAEHKAERLKEVQSRMDEVNAAIKGKK
ncbi:nucleolar protein 12-domain-containing protein [Cunninghamella echinulata]|nr:nucleolar protein 12-domain-containing protein [Cunninghamella echinulata]